MKLFAGIDGGGTKTKLWIVNDQKKSFTNLMAAQLVLILSPYKRFKKPSINYFQLLIVQ
jgi:activator of 2-hydroxyglutaryl-CoA dehydratase